MNSFLSKPFLYFYKKLKVMPIFNQITINQSHLARVIAKRHNNDDLDFIKNGEKFESNLSSFELWVKFIKKSCDKLTTTFNVVHTYEHIPKDIRSLIN